MAKINAALLAKLVQKLGISDKAVYRRIQEANVDVLERNLAALAFAADQRIGINKYSSADERAELRASRTGRGPAQSSAPPAKAARADTPRRAKSAPAVRKPKKDGSVFVVHGRNELLRKSIFDFLRCIGLEPLEWEKAVLKAKGGNPYVEDILRKAMEDVHVIVVLLTPDDEARLKPEFCKHGERSIEGKLRGQPRPNVLFEAGWAVGRFPEKTLLVQVGALREFTDIGGKHMLHLGNDAVKRTAFANRLRKFGCKIDLDGADWATTGDFKV
jgi:predicted nucleotide-binding protein